MAVLARLSPKFLAGNGDRTLSFANSGLPARPVVDFPRLKKLNFDGLVSFSGKPVRNSVGKSHLTSDAEVSTDFAGVIHGVQEKKKSETVRVVFKMEKKCKFGEQFLLVGDDPMLGFWNPSCAIPMNWSAGDVWTAQLDIPIEMTLQFKFILRNIKGEMIWQPGPDRIFKTWNCQNTIVVAETWEDPDAQKITEESLHQVQDRSTVSGFDKTDETMNSADKEMIAEAYAAMRKEEGIHGCNNPSTLYSSKLVTVEDDKYF